MNLRKCCQAVVNPLSTTEYIGRRLTWPKPSCSDPSANHRGIIQRESNNRMRFHTARVIHVSRRHAADHRGVSATLPTATKLVRSSETSRSATTGCEQSQQSSPLFNQLVGTTGER